MGYIIGGIFLCLTIVGIPFGVQTIKLGVATFAPFGKEVIEYENTNTVGNTIINMIWIILFGWEIAVAHLIHGIILAITIVGLPFAKQHFKLIPFLNMKFKISIIAFLFIALNAFTQTKTIEIEYQRNKDHSVDFFYKKSEPGSYLLSLKFKNVKNNY